MPEVSLPRQYLDPTATVSPQLSLTLLLAGCTDLCLPLPCCLHAEKGPREKQMAREVIEGDRGGNKRKVVAAAHCRRQGRLACASLAPCSRRD